MFKTVVLVILALLVLRLVVGTVRSGAGAPDMEVRPGRVAPQALNWHSFAGVPGRPCRRRRWESMSEDRRLAVLRAIVEDYVQSREPVGSKALVERHALGVSPATIRNDMAALEEEGLIAQPHTSAGRIPTDKGYRLFVDRLSTVKPLSQPERRPSPRCSTAPWTSTTWSTARCGCSRSSPTRWRSCSTRRSPARPCGTSSSCRSAAAGCSSCSSPTPGRVEHGLVDIGIEVPESTLGDLRARLNASVSGRRLTEVSGLVEGLPDRFAPDDRTVVRHVLDALEDTLAVEREERIVLAGTANLARAGTDFAGSISPVLEALEEQVVLLSSSPRCPRTAGGIGADRPREHQHAGLTETAGRRQRLRVGEGVGGGPARRARPHPDVTTPRRSAAVRAVASLRVADPQRHELPPNVH
jgi:heat-inducible transcriptional repressor